MRRFAALTSVSFLLLTSLVFGQHSVSKGTVYLKGWDGDSWEKIIVDEDGKLTVTGSIVEIEDPVTVEGTISIQEPLSIDDNSSSLTVDQSDAGQLNVTEASAAAIKTAVEIMDDWDDANYANANMNVAGTDVTANTGTVDAQTLRVTVATDDVVEIEGDEAEGVDLDASPVNPVVIAGKNIGNVITIPTMIAAGSFNVLGVVLADTGGDTVSITNSGAFVTGDEAHDAADAGNPVKIGGKAITALNTAVADEDRVEAIFDTEGRQIIVPHAPRDLIAQQTTTISDANETTILTAAASTFHDVTLLIISNTSNASTRVDIRDNTADTVRFSVGLAPKGGAVIPCQVPLTQTAVNDNWTAQLSTAVTDVRIFVQAIKNQ